MARETTEQEYRFYSDHPVAAILIHVADIAAGLDWYQRAFPEAIRTPIGETGFVFLNLHGIGLEIVPADAKVASGAAGSVVYWSVPDFDAALRHFEEIGAVLYRGPMDIEAGLTMCQVRDPWGNCVGLRGPRKREE